MQSVSAVSALRTRPSWMLGAEPAPALAAPVKQTFTTYAPILQSPLNLNVQVDKVVGRIEASGKWQVTSFAVRSGDQFKFLPIVPRFLQPTVQIVKFVMRRKDGVQSSKAAAEATVQAAALQQGLTLESFANWYTEVTEEVVVPSIPTPGKACDAVKSLTGIGCVGWGLIAGGVAAAVFFGPPIASALLSRSIRSIGEPPHRKLMRMHGYG